MLAAAAACSTVTQTPDAGLDATVADASDAGELDAPEAADADAGAPVVPAKLSDTGLFADIEAGVLASDIEEFEPRYVLWADNSTKTRWIRLKGSVDTQNMDHWSLPAGTRIWKEFRVAGVRVETRLIWRWGSGPKDFIYAAYQWNAMQTDADHVPNGVVNANGTTHDIPPLGACAGCHDVLRERVLGFSAIQLSMSPGDLTLEKLKAQGRLTAPPIGTFAPPGNATEQEALGYLHSNCGNCHNTDDGVKFVTPFSYRLLVGDSTVAQTGSYQSNVKVPLDAFQHQGITMRIAPGDLDASAVSYRMSVRGFQDQMPPVATKVPDAIGQNAVNAWIAALPP